LALKNHEERQLLHKCPLRRVTHRHVGWDFILLAMVVAEQTILIESETVFTIDTV